MNLFDMEREKNLKLGQNLAERFRPKSLDDYIGQEKVLNKNSFLYKAIKADRLPSLILYGPAGTGKTSLANVIANTSKSNFIKISAVGSGVSDLKKAVEEAKRLLEENKKTILFVDEIHRFNKAQQDFLLPYVEDSTVTLIGATTENPYFEVNSALISRCFIIRLEKMSEENLIKLAKKALGDELSGLASLKASIDDDALEYLVRISNGDARNMLNFLEIAVLSQDPEADLTRHIKYEDVKGLVFERAHSYDKSSTMHYDTISAFIKSMRGSDPDATVFYLAHMLNNGEDPLFIARRIVIFASEDIGLADPNAQTLATSAFYAVKAIGMPEARIILSNTAIYMALADKNNSTYVAINKAMADVDKIKEFQIPLHIRDAHNNDKKVFGDHADYKYPHNYKDKKPEQNYLPEGLEDKKYFNNN